jgi:hypothetical protein
MLASTFIAVLSSVALLAPEVPIQRPGGTEPAPVVEASPSADAPAAAPTSEAPPVESPETAVAAPPIEETPPAEPPPSTTDEVSNDIAIAQEYAASSDELDRRDKAMRRANSMIAIGAVTTLAGLVMLIAAVTEANKADCKFDLDTCANAPRPAVAKGLGAGAGIAIAGGIALVALGALKRYKLRPVVDANATSFAIGLRGRF